MTDLGGGAAVITGATGGLGKTVARTFAEHGARLALLSPDPKKLDALAQEVRGTGVTANVLQVRAIDLERAHKPGWGQPEEIAAAMLYLCSAEGGLLNGARLPLVG